MTRRRKTGRRRRLRRRSGECERTLRRSTSTTSQMTTRQRKNRRTTQPTRQALTKAGRRKSSDESQARALHCALTCKQTETTEEGGDRHGRTGGEASAALCLRPTMKLPLYHTAGRAGHGSFPAMQRDLLQLCCLCVVLCLQRVVLRLLLACAVLSSLSMRVFDQ